MIRQFLTTTFISSLVLSSAAMAQQSATGPYATGAIGQSIFWDTDLDVGGDIEYEFFSLFISGALGMRITPNLRAEAELLFESADIENSGSDIEVFRGTVSGYFDLNPIAIGGFDLAPYAGGGVGFAHVDLFDDDFELTWHAEGGASIPIGDNLELVPGIRFEYITLDQFNVDDDSLWITQLRAGVRYSF